MVNGPTYRVITPAKASPCSQIKSPNHQPRLTNEARESDEHLNGGRSHEAALDLDQSQRSFEHDWKR